MLAVSWDTIRLFLHVLAATIWVGRPAGAGRARPGPAPGQPERHETPNPARFNAVKSRFHGVRQQADRQGTERAGLIAHAQDYRSISRAMTSCWIWLVPS